MYNSVILYLLVLIGGSAYSRVAISDDPLPDISTNSLTDEKQVNNSAIHIGLSTIQPEVQNTTESHKDQVIEQSITEITIQAAHNVTDVQKGEQNTTESTVTPTPDNIDALLNLNCTIDSINSIDSDGDLKCEDKTKEEPPLILTEYIKENRIEDARNASRVNPEFFLGVESYSGYFTVNETYGSNVFFWYFPVEKKAVDKAPWIVWLQGGPGASSMTGLFDEIGPFRYTGSDELVRNPYTWLQNHSLVFIDNPVGTGFSFTNSDDGYVRDMDTYGSHLYSVIHQFLQVFPELRAAPLYVAGESYGGKYVPALAIQLHRKKETGEEEVNLQGLITGNAYVDPPMISQLERPFYYFGLLQAEQIEVIKPLIDAFKKDVADNNSAQAKKKWNSLITVLLLLSNQKHAYNFLRDELNLGRYASFLRKPHIKQAIHVGQQKCSFVSMLVNKRLDGDFLSSAKGLYEELLDHYRVLTYCGQLDQMLPCVLTSENYRTWRWSGSDQFLQATRMPFIHDNKMAGYHKSGGNLTEVVLRGAGHMAPMDAPPQTQALIARWTHRLDLGHLGLLSTNFVQDYVRNNSQIHNLDIVHYL